MDPECFTAIVRCSNSHFYLHIRTPIVHNSGTGENVFDTIDIKQKKMLENSTNAKERILSR